MATDRPSVESDVSPAIKAQNPDLETAWRQIAWWEQTCAYWWGEAQKGYALRDSLSTSVTSPEVSAAPPERGTSTTIAYLGPIPPEGTDDD